MKNQKKLYKVILLVNEKETLVQLLKVDENKKQLRKAIKKLSKKYKLKVKIIKIKKLSVKGFKRAVKKLANQKAKEFKRIKLQELKKQKRIAKEKAKEIKEQKRLERKKQKEELKAQRKLEREQKRELAKEQKMLKKLEGKQLWEVVLSTSLAEDAYHKISTYICQAKKVNGIILRAKEALVKKGILTQDQIDNLKFIVKQIPATNWELILEANKKSILF